MHGNDVGDAQQFTFGISRFLRTHGEVAANGHEHHIGFVVLSDQAHVAKQTRVTHVVDLEAVF